MKRKDDGIQLVTRPSSVTRELRDDASDRDLLLYVLRRSEEQQERHEAAMQLREERHEAAMRAERSETRAAMQVLCDRMERLHEMERERDAGRVKEASQVQSSAMRLMGESLQRERDSHARFLEATTAAAEAEIGRVEGVSDDGGGIMNGPFGEMLGAMMPQIMAGLMQALAGASNASGAKPEAEPEASEAEPDEEPEADA